tara:strand:+ start:325 stop:747 length:423 start_codon:yes stop_codon:yes gene_type:complete
MEEEFYAIIKLVSGEEVMALVSVDDNDNDPIIILQKPLILKMNNYANASFIKVKPWIELTDEDIFMIKLDKIITITETNNQRIIDIYNNYNSGDPEPPPPPHIPSSGEVSLDSKMGYISSVKDARKRLEALFNLNQNKES